MNDLMKKYHLEKLDCELGKNRDLLTSLIREIIGQQLSGKVAGILFDRFKNLFPERKVRPEDILQVPDPVIRSSGLSFAKIRCLKSLSQAVLDGRLDFGKIHGLANGEVVKVLTQVKGIGPWTAEMFLIFTLGRPDVFSLGDLGLRKAISRLYGVATNDSKKIEELSNVWRPYRSFACRYLWRSLDGD